MQPDLNYLRRHYASLSDDAFFAINREELVESAQRCYDEELAHRKPAADVSENAAETSVEQLGDDEPAGVADGDEPAWLEDAACVGTFVEYPGSQAAADAENARAALEAAGIPCYLSLEPVASERPSSHPQQEYRVLVPGGLNLHATSVLDRDVFNEQIEADWRSHFEALSDNELRALHPDAICAGLVDRVQRLKRAYEDEISRRRLSQA